MSLARAFSNLRTRVVGVAFQKALILGAGKIADQARKNASYSSRIPGAISVKSPKVEDGKTTITIEVDLEKAPHARAMEYGSGKHGEKGERYRIDPKNADALKFDWPDPKDPVTEPKGKIISKIGNFYTFRYVEHPGVEKRPYLVPALTENQSFLLKLISKALLDNIRIAFKESQL